VFFLFVFFAGIYLFALCLLAIYGINFLYLTWVAGRSRPISPPRPLENYPHVTVQLPIYNELFVVEKLIATVVQLDYPEDKLHIQVLDDSTDDTCRIAKDAVTQWQRRGKSITYIHRDHRVGFKAGALAHGMKLSKSAFFAIFDADFQPQPDFLLRAMPYFYSIRHQDDTQPKIGFVQGRWGHLNGKSSLLTTLQAFGIDGHFAIEQQARWNAGHIFNFNGTAGIWRRAAIEDAGGWSAETLTEDLDLSYRAALQGWKSVYVDTLEVPAELPDQIAAFRRQQRRWALGSFQTAFKTVPRVLHAPLSLKHKIQACMHLTAYTIQIWMALVGVLYLPLLLIINNASVPLEVFNISWIFNLTAVAPTLMFMVAQWRRESAAKHFAEKTASVFMKMPHIFLLSVLGSGMMLNTVRAMFQLFLQKHFVFERTPKMGASNQKLLTNKRIAHYHIGLDPIVFAEIIFAMWNGVSMFIAWQLGFWGVMLYAGLFMIGLGAVAGSTLLQTRTTPRND
jgi:cellulose synthase/poly-beta-1,6-N-acetylglucosamine synthase-like glycosyltransferase